MLKDTYRALFDSIGPKEETSEQVLAAMEEAEKKKIPAVAPTNRSRSFTAPLLTAVAAGVVVLTAVILFLTVTRPPMPSDTRPGLFSPTGTKTDSTSLVKKESDPLETVASTELSSDFTEVPAVTENGTRQEATGQPVSTEIRPPVSTGVLSPTQNVSDPDPTVSRPDQPGSTVTVTPPTEPGPTEPALPTADAMEWTLGPDNWATGSLKEKEGDEPLYLSFRLADPALVTVSEPLFVYGDLLVAAADYPDGSATGVFIYRIQGWSAFLVGEYRQEGKRLHNFFEIDGGSILINLVTRSYGEEPPAVIRSDPTGQNAADVFRVSGNDLLSAAEEPGLSYLFMTSVRVRDGLPELASMMALYGEEAPVNWDQAGAAQDPTVTVRTITGNTFYSFAYDKSAWSLRDSAALS